MADAREEFTGAGGIAALWTGVLGPPLLALLALEVNYALVDWACTRDASWVLHAVAALLFLLALATGGLAWRTWRRAGEYEPGEGAGVVPRSRFLAMLGVMISPFFALVIVGIWLPNLIVGPCMRH
jgi:hypothetical protein